MLVILLSGVTALWAQSHFVPPWGPDLAPRWTPVPQAPGIDYVPDQRHDLFRYGKQFTITVTAAGIGVTASTVTGR